MAVLTPELQKELVKVELEKKMRGEMKDALKAVDEVRELNEKENAALIADINKIMAGRDAWLKQMREAQMREKRRALTLAEEKALNDQANQLLTDARNFIANFKYESDETPDVDPKNANKTGLEGMLSNFGSDLGLGDNPIFNFLGKLFAFIMHFIKGVKETFNPEKAPADVVEDLVKEGSFDEAELELTKQENELINKLKPFAEHKGNEEIKEALEAYETQLAGLKKGVPVLNDKDEQESVLALKQTTGAYREQVLSLRTTIFNRISSTLTPGLIAHAAVVSETERKAAKEKQVSELQRVHNAIGDEGKHAREALQARMNALRVDVADLEAKRLAAVAKEARFRKGVQLSQGKAAEQIRGAFELNKPLFDAEIARQKTFAKAKADAAAAEIAHRRAVELTQTNRQAAVGTTHV